ncbi:tetratricopeptide repeat protein [Sulfurimonas sp. SWIR-19]|uniref:tetratricopeptide repeat protein n=1 Tax=Sulfurimonas sp. SWIR-19 TaxID=2878390 RepID=UPI001CF5FCAE|nr:tetratricopeptide repeat protein [Sulfurimonas sp. SWIR-19]UCM99704.1 tetratricopeptide repeat protein [Sulfurimonas sp. SWIR-19]
MFTKILQSLLLTLLLSSHVIAKKDDAVSIDHIALATLMIYDGKYEKAHEELDVVNQKSPTFDAAKYYTVLGVLYSKEGKTKKAIQAYKEAIEATKTKEFKAPKVEIQEKYLFSIGSHEKQKSRQPEFNPKKKRQEKLEQLYMYLASEYYKIKDYKNTVKSLDNAGEKGKNRAELFTLRAECYYKTKAYDSAIKALNTGMKLFPKSSTVLLKQKFYYLADLGLYQSAIKTAKEYMQQVNSSSKEYIALAQMLLETNQIDSAVEILEDAKLRFPKNAKLSFLLGHLYLKKDMKFTTANLFEESSYFDKKYLKDAVEMNRRVGQTTHALYLNTHNIDKVEKLKQKIALYLDAQEFRKIIGLKKALLRYKMLDDDNLRYALAYSYYMAGDYKNAEKELKHISNSELFNKATIIRKNIEKCTNNSLECL